jgi:hypothetical protein
MRTHSPELDALESMILEGEEQLAKFEQNLDRFDWEPERSIHILALMCDRLNDLIRERDALLAREVASIH